MTIIKVESKMGKYWKDILENVLNNLSFERSGHTGEILAVGGAW